MALKLIFFVGLVPILNNLCLYTMRKYTTGLTRNNVPSNPNISQFEYLCALKLQKSHDEISNLSTFGDKIQHHYT